MNKKDVLARVGYVRNQAGLSQRELSLRMGMSHQYISKVERGMIGLSVEKLLDILLICNFPLEKFFYEKPEEYEKDKELLTLIKALPAEKKSSLIAFIKK